MVRSIPSQFRVDPETKAALERAAKEDGRTVSSLVFIIVREWLKSKGYLKD